MIKTVLLPEIFVAALQGEEKATAVIEKCKQDPQIQPWTLGTAMQTLVEGGFSKEEIRATLTGVPKIPINDKLAQAALDSEHGYTKGLHLAAAKTFRSTVVIGCEEGAELDGVRFLSIEQGLELKEGAYDINVDFMNPSLQIHPIFDQVDSWFTDIIQNTAFAGGNHVAEFEKEFAEYSNTLYAVGVASGTDALLFALLAMGIGPGDEVITVPNTFIATTEAISQTGATPIFVDVLPDTYNMNPALLEEKITKRTKAILPVHLYGQIADMDPILDIAAKYDLKVLEDAAQAQGAEYKGKRAGGFGNAAAFSLYPGKNLGAFGEAGVVTTNDPAIAQTISCLRDHGQAKKYYHKMEGYNGRMDNMQAAACRAKLPLLDDWNEKRRALAAVYDEQLGDFAPVLTPVISEGSAPVFHLYVVHVDEPKKLNQYLAEKGIYSGFHYPVSLHLQEAYADRGERPGSYPVAEMSASALISLPMFPEMTKDQVIRVCDEIKKFYE